MLDFDTKRDPIDQAASRHAPFDASQAWVKVSIAEAARMTAESVRIVARSKATVLRIKRGERAPYTERADL